MARYFFNLHDDSDGVDDKEGGDHPTIDDAVSSALRYARGILGDELSQGRLPLDWTIEVVAERTGERREVRFADAVKVTGI